LQVRIPRKCHPGGGCALIHDVVGSMKRWCKQIEHGGSRWTNPRPRCLLYAFSHHHCHTIQVLHIFWVNHLWTTNARSSLKTPPPVQSWPWYPQTAAPTPNLSDPRKSRHSAVHSGSACWVVSRMWWELHKTSFSCSHWRSSENIGQTWVPQNSKWPNLWSPEPERHLGP